MSTIKQKIAAKKMVENGCSKTQKEIMKESGYSDAISTVPKKVTESKGFKEEMAKYGLTEELISCALVSDIEAKIGNRKGELELGAKILRMGQQEGDNEFNINIRNWT